MIKPTVRPLGQKTLSNYRFAYMLFSSTETANTVIISQAEENEKMFDSVGLCGLSTFQAPLDQSLRQNVILGIIKLAKA